MQRKVTWTSLQQKKAGIASLLLLIQSLLGELEVCYMSGPIIQDENELTT